MLQKTITYFDNKFHCLYGDGACDSVKMVVDFLSVAGEIQIQLIKDSQKLSKY